MSSDGARTARLVALMAANAYAFVKVVDHVRNVFTPSQEHPWFTLMFCATPAVGLAGAYLALCATSGTRTARIFEQTSLFLITVLIAAFLAMAAGKMGLM